MNNHKVYLYKPGGTASDFLGELLVDNLNVNIKLHDMSTISFTIPEKVNNTPNIRLDEVLDGYIVELWYGQVDGVYNPPSQKDFEKIRFVLHKTPLDFNDFKRTYSYEGHSIESNLELRQITNWPGVFISDFYRLITYNNSTPNQYTEVAATGETIPNHPYSVTAKTTPNTGKYIRIAPTTATATPLDIYVYEIREDTDPSAEKYNEIAYVRYTGSTYDESGFKQGYYFLDLDANEEYVEYIYIYVPDKYDDFDGETYKKLRFKVYDNPISRHYAVGVNRNSENPFTDYYIDLAQDVEDGDPAEYGNYTFTTQKIRSKNGLKLEHVLLGNIETRDISNNIDNNTLTDDGLLYNTDFTIGTIHTTIAAKYRSNLEFNNITVYQAIKDIAESFDAIAVFDTIAKTVSFYPENADTWPNNGLILKYGTYLKNISKDIDASKIVTAAKGVGKDNSGIELITPDGNDYWEDFSYYLDEFYIDKDLTLAQLYAAGFTFTLQNPSTNVYYLDVSYPDGDNTDSFQSRWMDAAEAKKLAKWQFNRDFLHKVLLGEILPSVADNTIGVNLSAMDRFYDLYNTRSKEINDYVQSDTVLSIRKAEYFRYKYLYDFYDKKVNLGGASVDEEERYLYYKNLWQQAQTAVATQEAIVENKRLEIFTTTVADSIGDKLAEVRTALNKNTTFSVDLDKLNSFIKEAVVTDSKLDNDLDLLDAVVTHVDENKIPRVTLNVGIVNILAAQESYDDWNKLRVGDLVNVYFPEFNIDEEIQIREIGIDFEQHTASLVIASVRNYNKSRGNYTSKNIKKLLTANRNDLNNIEDAARVSSNESQDTYNKLNGGTINATNSVIAFGTKDTSDNYGNKIDGSGASLSVVSNVDPITETFQFSSNKSLFILDGSVQSFYDEGSYVTQVEVSGENGFIIRRITGDVETDTLNVEKLMYINTNGDAIFTGFVSINQDENNIGYNKEGVFIGEDNNTSKLSLISENTSLIFNPDAADYKLIVTGEAKLGPLTIGSVGETFAVKDITTNVGSIASSSANPTTISRTYNWSSQGSYETVYSVEVPTYQFSQGGSLSNRQIYIQLYQVAVGGSATLVYTSETITIENDISYFSSYLFDFTIPQISANRVIVTATSNTSGGLGGTLWSIEDPNIVISNSELKMGLFSVDSAGILQTYEGTFGPSSQDRIKISPYPSTQTPSYIATIIPKDLTDDRQIDVPNQSGTILLNSITPLTEEINILTSDGNINITASGVDEGDINITASGLNKDINITANDNLILTSTANDVELNAADHIDLTATNGTYIYGDLTVNNNLIVKGTTITVDSTTLTVNDKNIELGSIESATRSFTILINNDTITGGSTLGLFEGQTISGIGIPAGTTIESIINTSSLRMSANATANGTPGSLTFGRKFNTQNGSATITNGNTAGLIPGQSISGTGIPANTTISSITNSTTLVMSNNATATNTQTSLVFGSATDITANGGGITLLGSTNKTIIWYNDIDAWEFNQSIELVSSSISLDAGQSLRLSGFSDATHRIYHDASTDYDVIDYSTGVQFRHYNLGNQLTLTGSNGRVGIGTISPSEKLDVDGNIAVSGTVDGVDISALNTTVSGKVDKSGDTMTGNLTISKVNPLLILSETDSSDSTYPGIQFDTALGQGVKLYHNEFDSQLPTAGYGLVLGPSSNNTQFPSIGTLSLVVLGEIYAGSTTLGSTQRVFHDGYHPNADTLTTARTLTIGSTGKTFNGSANVSWSLEEIGAASLSPTMDTKTANYTLALTDAGKVLRVNSSSAVTITIPANITVAIPVNTEIAIIRYGTGTVSIIPVGVTVTLRSFSNYQKIKDQYTSAALKKIDTNEWILVGNLGA